MICSVFSDISITMKQNETAQIKYSIKSTIFTAENYGYYLQCIRVCVLCLYLIFSPIQINSYTEVDWDSILGSLCLFRIQEKQEEEQKKKKTVSRTVEGENNQQEIILKLFP